MAVVSTVVGVLGEIMRRRSLVMSVCRMLVRVPATAMTVRCVHYKALP